ncbi:ATP-binding protein [Roseovarius sp. MMSF_3359]|uniref:sensor histidine kinase n=2 Tax=unclassified Roseovarius TaxID=2614913 RepID=UPI00353190FC
MRLTRSLSLKMRLGLGAAALGAATLLTAGILYLGLQQVASRLDTALASEQRMARYATLSTQVATFLVIGTEAIQTGQSAEIRMDRLDPVVNQINGTFLRLRADVEDAVIAAEELGLDAQSRYGTQSLGLARMEAMLNNTLDGLSADTDDTARLRAHVDTFASSFDPLLSQAVNTEVLFRNATLSSIDALRRTLILTSLVIAGMTMAVVALFYLGLIRPQFRRLDRLRAAAHQIGQEDFDVALPVTRPDEIGQLYTETNRMAAALSARYETVQEEWARLNDTIAQRTEDLRNANAKLSEIDENRRRFFADVSHELRTPLTVILMEAQIGRQAAPEAAEAFATIEARAGRLNRRIDDLLRVARSDSGQLALEDAAVSVDDLLEEVTKEVQAELDNAGMTLSQAQEPGLSLNCDPNWVRQVLVSLISNAIRHARDGGQVRLEAARTEHGVELSVTDNGPGIPPKDQDRIFDRFAQAGQTQAQGFGIGLALARWVIDAQGGQITVTSPVGRDEALGSAPGTKISVRLPDAED